MLEKLNARKNMFENDLCIFFEVFAVSIPACLSDQFDLLRNCWRVLFFVALLMVLFTFLFRVELHDIPKFAAPVLMYLIILVSTLINGGFIKTAIVRLVYYPYCIMLVYNCCKRRGNQALYSFLKYFRDILLVWLIINFITVILFPNGMYDTIRLDGTLENRHWFLGVKNGIGKTAMIEIALSAIYYSITENKRDQYILIAMSLLAVVTAILDKSSSGLAGALMISFLTLMTFWGSFKRIEAMRMYTYAAVIAFLFAGLVCTDFLLGNPIVVFIVQKILHRNLNLTNRIYIWDSVKELIKSNFWLGMGYRESFADVIGVTNNASDAHDFYLEFFLEGGIFCFVGMLIFLGQMIRRLDQGRKIFQIQVLSVSLFSLMTVFITENCNGNYIWLFFGLCIFLPEKLARGEMLPAPAAKVPDLVMNFCRNPFHQQKIIPQVKSQAYN